MKNSIPFNNNENKNSKDFFISKIFSFRWFRISFFLVILIIGFLIFRQISNQLILLLITSLPLFFGFAFSYISKPFVLFLKKYFSEKTSQIISYIFISFLIVVFLVGIIILFLYQLKSLYDFLIEKTPSNIEVKGFFEGIKDKEITSTNLEKLELISVNDQWNFSYKVIKKNEVTTSFKNSELSGIFVLLIKMFSTSEYFKGISIKLMSFFYKLSNKGYIDYLWSNLNILFMILYIIVFSLFIAAFSMGKGQSFYSKIWNFFTKQQEKDVKEKLKFELTKNLKSWSKGVFIEQTYIFLGTGFFIFLTGIIWRDSGFLDSVFALTLIMSLCNLIPYIGPWIGVIPIVGLGISHAIITDVSLFVNWLPFIVAVGGTVLIQVGQSLLVAPLVYSQQLKIGPVTIIMALVFFGVLFGVFSMIFALPVIIMIKTILSVVYKKEWKI